MLQIDNQSHVIRLAANWLNEFIGSSFVIIVMVLAIAFFGISMLSGRVSIIRGAEVLLGCFILTGAYTISEALIVAIPQTQSVAPLPDRRPIETEGIPTLDPAPRLPVTLGNPFDPYAGEQPPR